MAPAAWADAPQAGLSLEKSVWEDTLSPGEATTYHIKTGCSSSTSLCINAQLVDEVPEPLVIEGVNVTGLNASDYEVTIEGNKITVDFFEKHESGAQGINDGSTPDVYVEVRLPENAPPELNGSTITNSAEVTADNASPRQDSADILLEVPVTLRAGINKAWSPSSLPTGSKDPVTLSLTDISNRSNVGADTLRVTEPSNDSDPFGKVELIAIGDVTFPEGATQVQVDALVGGQWQDGTPSPSAALPGGLEASEVQGLRFTFTADGENAIVAGGTAGAIHLHTKLRDGGDGEIGNEASARVTNSDQGESELARDDATLTVEAANYRISASKSITPVEVVEGNVATVEISGKNESNQALGSITLTEPAGSSAFFTEGVEFVGFAETTWPAGATDGVATINGTDHSISEDDDGNVKWPSVLPDEITGFSITFTGTFQPEADVNAKFEVKGTETSEDPYLNTVQADGVPHSGNEDIDPATANATLKVIAPIKAYDGWKSVAPKAIEGAAGDEVQVTLATKVDNSSNVPVTEIVQTDEFSGQWKEHFKVSRFTIANDQGADSVTVEYLDGVGGWTVLTTTDGEYDVPADAAGVRVTYNKSDGFPRNQEVRANITFEVTETIEHETSIDNILLYSGGGESTGTVTADEELKLSTSKSWSPSKVVVKPGNATPTSTLTVSTKNVSTYAVNKLALSEPGSDTEAFDYVDLTGLSVKLDDGIDSENLKVTLTIDGDTDQTFTGADALEPVGVDWPNVIGFEAVVENSSEVVVPRDAGFEVTVGTQLREQVRGSDTAMTEALEGIEYRIDNTVDSEIERDGEDKSDSADNPLFVETKESVDISTEAKKWFDPDHGSLYVPGGGSNTTTVHLGLVPGEDKPDTITFEDVDPQFWNAFDFREWKGFRVHDNWVTEGVIDLKLEYLTGRDFESNGDALTASEGEWVEAPSTYSIQNANDLPNGFGTALPDGLDPGDVQGIRVNITNTEFDVLSGVWSSALNAQGYVVSFDTSPRETLRSGETHTADVANPGETKVGDISNAVKTKAKRLDGPVGESSADGTYTLTPGEKALSVTKRDSSGTADTQVASGGEITYVFTVTNSGAEPLNGLIVTDLLPSDNLGAQLLVDEDKDPVFETDSVTMPVEADEIDMIVDYEASEPFVRFVFPASSILMPGEKYTIKLPTKVRPAHTPTKVDNVVVVTDGADEVEAADTAVFRVITGQSYESRKLVREVIDDGQEATGNVIAKGAAEGAQCTEFEGGFYRYPCVVETQPGGKAEWKLTVKNTGNVDADELEILDILPWIGDTGVHPAISNIPRGSEWVPTLTSISTPIVPEGVTASLHYYVGDPADCVPSGPSSNPWQGCDAPGAWSTTEPEDLSTVKALKWVFSFEDGSAFKPLDEVELRFITTSAIVWPDDVDTPPEAWNSFAYKVHAEVNGRPDYRGQEPNKTGITYRNLKSYAIGDYVWIDSNRDGIQDENEDPLEGVKAELYNADDEFIDDTVTDDQGRYIFDNLPAGEYKVKFTLTEEQAETYRFTSKNSGDDVAADSDADPATGWTETIYLDDDNESLTRDYDDQDFEATRGIDPTWDAGVILKSYAVGDYVWVDSDRDGVQGNDEDPLAGVTVTLTTVEDEPVYDVLGQEVTSVQTNAQGRYLFDNLPAGEYKVHFELTDAQAEVYTFTSLEAGDDAAVDSNADPDTGWTTVIVLDDSNGALTSDYDRVLKATEGVDPTWDAGVIRKAVSVGDYVWIDENRDGIQDEGEPGLPDVTLCLIGPDGEPVTDVFGDPVGPVVTDENGYYSFENLPALQGDETYTVCIDREASEEVLKPYTPTKEHQGDDRGEDSSTWEASTEPGDLHNDGDRDPTLDFGFVTKSYAIGDYVWIDSNGDGVQGEDEDPLEGVTVELYDSEGELIASTTTDEHGRYLFDNLPAGSYKVKFTLTDEQAAIYEFTSLNTGNDESSNDSDADPATGWTQDIVLGDSNDALTLEYDRELGATEGIDPTWDAGVVLKLVAPDEVPGPDDLPEMGAEINGPLIGLAALLLLAGAATIGLVRRQS